MEPALFMKKYLPLIGIIVALYIGWGQLGGPPGGQPGGQPVGQHEAGAPSASGGNEAIAIAFRDQRSGVHVSGQGVVVKVLADDNDGSRHQRFILDTGAGPTLLVAHNIDLAPRLTSLKVGDTVAFSGVYEWNPKGGLIHWTHHDPGGQHQAGWLRHNGQTSQ
jgi:hypothetical protein